MIQDLCRRLKEKRRQFGFDLEEVVEKTKLHPSIIKSIEAGDLESINPIYLKGYIRIYASFLGVTIGDELDEISPKREQRKTLKSPEPEKVSVPPREPVDFSKMFTPEVKRNLMRVAAVLVVCIIAVFILSSLVRFAKKQIARSSQKQEAAQQTDGEAAQKAAVEEARAAGEMTASLKVKRDCFVRAKLDGKIVFEGVLRRGVVESWHAKKEIEFKISDGSSVDLEVNGKLYPPLSKIRKPIKSLRITPEGIFTDK